MLAAPDFDFEKPSSWSRGTANRIPLEDREDAQHPPAAAIRSDRRKQNQDLWQRERILPFVSLSHLSCKSM